MEYCKYHPLAQATYSCDKCSTFQCKTCIDDSPKTGTPMCIICQSPLSHMGDGHLIEPFWRNLQDAFKYPLNGNSITLMVGVAIGTTLLTYIPFIFSILVSLALTGAMLKYCFRCLENTATGDMSAPDITEAYSGGMGLLVQLFMLVILLALIIGFIGGYVGMGLASFLGMAVFISFPAILIRYAQSESIFDAINPFTTLQLIMAIGLPYAVLIAILMIMMGSVAVLNQLVGIKYSLLSNVASSLVFNYYLVVSFHIMGYMLFQYQDRLGYSAHLEKDESPCREENDRYIAFIDVQIKEGEYEKAIDLFYEAFKKFPKDIRFFNNYYNFILRAEKPNLLKEYADTYMQALLKAKKYELLNPVYKQLIKYVPSYVPAIPEARVLIARAARSNGDSALAVKLINGMHKLYPGYSGLEDAYLLMAESLSDLPNMQSQADKCRRLAAQIKASQEKRHIANKGSEKVRFNVQEPEEEIKNSNAVDGTDILDIKENDDKKDLAPIEFKL